MPTTNLVCEECGRKATKGYWIDKKRYCDKCAEDLVRRSTREMSDHRQQRKIMQF